MRERTTEDVSLPQNRLPKMVRVIMVMLGAALLLSGGLTPGQSQAEEVLRYKQAVRTEMEGIDLRIPPVEMVYWIRGPRQRNEDPRQQLVTITQCDLQRIIYVNQQNRTCLIQPLGGEGSSARAQKSAPPKPAESPASQPPRRGGTITLTGEIKDTGETRMMFGRRARRFILHQVFEGSPDSCAPGRMEMTVDTWTINLPEWRCEVKQPRHLPPTLASRPDCFDQIRVSMKGTDANLGEFPLLSRMTMTVGGQTMSITMEITELTSGPADDALFDIPPDCRVMTDAGAFWAGFRPTGVSLSEALKGTRATIESAGTSAATPEPKRPGILRVGVRLINTSGTPLDLPSLRQGMVSVIRSKGGGKLDAVDLVATEQAALQAEAQAKDVDYVLMVSLREAKQAIAGKLGGLIGRRIGIGGGDKTAIKLDYHWIDPKNMETLATRSLSQEVKGEPPDAAAEFCRTSAENAVGELWRLIKK